LTLGGLKIQLFDGAVVVGVDADVRGDAEALFHDAARVQVRVVEQRAGGGCAKGPPEPIAMRLSSGSITSPLPVMMSEVSLSATASSASRRRSARSVRQAFASSTAERTRWPWCFSSCASNNSNSVKASAVPPAKPASTLSLYRRRTLRALPFITVLPMETWPSPPITTLLPRRTESMVVPRNCSTFGLLWAVMG
jgi:hypothetical protein